MDIKSLAKDLPLCGQMAIGTALRALAVAGHLRRVRCRVEGDGQCRWVTLTYWSRAAHDNEWWIARLAGEATAQEQAPVSFAAQPAVPQQRTAQRDITALPSPDPARSPQAPESEPDTNTPPPAEASTSGAPTSEAPPARESSPAFLALAQLGRRETRLALSAADCAALEPLAAAWFARGVGADHLTSALTNGLPERIGSPVGLVRRRLTDKMPPRLPATPAPAQGLPGTPVGSLLVECTECGRPGQAEALPDGLCRPCRTVPQSPEPPGQAASEQVERDVPALVASLRNLMRTP